MIKINLLPHREEAKKKRKDEFMLYCIFSVLVGGLVIGCVYLYYQMRLEDQINANSLLQEENARLKSVIAEVAQIEAEIRSLEERQGAVENLQSERNLPVELLNKIIEEVPNGAYVSSLKRIDKNISINGMAQTNQTVSELLQNINDVTLWATRPQLKESKLTELNIAQNQKRQVYAYSVDFKLDDVKPDSPDQAQIDPSPAR